MERSALTYRELLERAESGRPEKFLSGVKQAAPLAEERVHSNRIQHDPIDDIEQIEKRQDDKLAVSYKFGK